MGVVLFIMLSGAHPFDQRGDLPAAAIKELSSRGAFSFTLPVWARVSPFAIDIIRRLLRVDQVQRLTAAQALTHAWWAAPLLQPRSALRGPSAMGAATTAAPAATTTSPGKRRVRVAATASISAARLAAGGGPLQRT